MAKIKIDPKLFGPNPAEQVENLMQIGVVTFAYWCNKDKTLHTRRGTRDLSNSNVSFDLLPMGIKEPPAHVLTYIDLDCQGAPAWRCCYKSMILWMDDEIEIDD